MERIKEIVNRGTFSVFTIDEMQDVVVHYIYKRKNIKVEINIMKGLNPNHIFFSTLYQNEVMNLMEAFNIAVKYLVQNQ